MHVIIISARERIVLSRDRFCEKRASYQIFDGKWTEKLVKCFKGYFPSSITEEMKQEYIEKCRVDAQIKRLLSSNVSK